MFTYYGADCILSDSEAYPLSSSPGPREINNWMAECHEANLKCFAAKKKRKKRKKFVVKGDHTDEMCLPAS